MFKCIIFFFIFFPRKKGRPRRVVYEEIMAEIRSAQEAKILTRLCTCVPEARTLEGPVIGEKSERMDPWQSVPKGGAFSGTELFSFFTIVN